MSKITRTYRTPSEKEAIVKGHEEIGDRVISDNHKYKVERQDGEVYDVFDKGVLTIDTEPDNTPLPVIDPFAAWKVAYSTAATTEEKVDLLARYLGLEGEIKDAIRTDP